MSRFSRNDVFAFHGHFYNDDVIILMDLVHFECWMLPKTSSSASISVPFAAGIFK